MVVIEDADLIARQRTEMNNACDEVMLNKLLNELDGLRERLIKLYARSLPIHGNLMRELAESALHEMLFSGGSLNKRLLGGDTVRA